jgi:hypothetical protein
MKKLLLLLVIYSCPSYSAALLGGEITCRNINGLMYETSLTIYRDTTPGNLPLSYTISYLDSIDTIITSHVVITPPGVAQWNGFISYKYIDTISFPYTGSFKAIAWDCCRDSVDNILNSTSSGMYLDCKILADGSNSNPQFLSVPITIAQLNQPFTNNITPYDADRDSLSWELTFPEDWVSNSTGGFSIISLPYNYPPSDASLPFHIDSILGDISFKPNVAGKYQIAVKIIEWRNGLQIGYVKRDIELMVIPVTNSPLVIQSNFQISCSQITTWLNTWNQGAIHPDIYIKPNCDLVIHLTMSDPDIWGFPYSLCLGSSLINTSAYASNTGNNAWAAIDYLWGIITNNVSDQPYFVTFRTFEKFNSISYYGRLYNDYTFRIFVNNTTTSGFNEIGNESKSIYFKSMDVLGREIDPNSTGFRIDVYKDGKTRKVFRAE